MPLSKMSSGEVRVRDFRGRLCFGLAIALAALLAIPLTSVVGATNSAFASEQLFSSRNDWEPNVAADPSSPYVYIVTTGLDSKACQQCPEPSITYRVSPDGGASWGPVLFVCATECKSNNLASAWQADPVVRVAQDGTVYVLWLDNWNPGPQLSKSFDHGQTWTRPVITGNSGAGWADKPWLVISPDGKDVYVAWNHGDPYISFSHDYGQTFSTPMRLTPSTNKLFYYPEGGAVAPDRSVYFSMSIETSFGTGPVGLAVAKSADAGASWSINMVESSQESPGCPAGTTCITDELQAQIVLDVDSAGTIMVAYMKNAQAGQPKQFYSRTSTDGVHWSSPSKVNAEADSNFPVIAHGPKPGDFRVAWQDNRNGPTAWNTYYKRTVNSGNSWSSEVKLSDLGTGGPYKTPAGYAFPYGDYFGIAVGSAGTSYIAWGEGTGRETTGGTWFTHGS